MMLVQLQEAFYLTDRVMTLSFHKFGNQFFPGTGKDFTPLVQGLNVIYWQLCPAMILDWLFLYISSAGRYSTQTLRME